jgi:hypothetical protein
MGPQEYDCTLIDIDMKSEPAAEGMEFRLESTIGLTDSFTTVKTSQTWVLKRAVTSKLKKGVDADRDFATPEGCEDSVYLTDIVSKSLEGNFYMAKSTVGKRGDAFLSTQNWND